ncbi:MAG: serine hydrolase domain-containing protein, partial [Pyrinomonadaceae bacterium]
MLLALLLTGHQAPAQASKPAATLANTERARYESAADYSERTRGLSVLVMKGGRAVFEQYQNGHAADTPHMLASGTKSFSGVMAAAAVADGLLKLDEPVSQTVTEWKSDPRKSKVTIRQLLSLTGGVEAGRVGRPPAYAEAITFAPVADPGTKFEYGPAPFQIFGEVMRRKLAAKKETPLDYLKRRVLDPIGLRVAEWTHRDG